MNILYMNVCIDIYTTRQSNATQLNSITLYSPHCRIHNTRNEKRGEMRFSESFQMFKPFSSYRAK